VTERFAVRLVPFNAAVIVATVDVVTLVVVAVKVALVAPETTVTALGTPATLLLLDNETTAPPVGAGPLSVTVPCDEVPPVTLDGAKASEDRVAAPGGPSGAGSTHRIG
jgi:hypothetical protein